MKRLDEPTSWQLRIEVALVGLGIFAMGFSSDRSVLLNADWNLQVRRGS